MGPRILGIIAILSLLIFVGAVCEWLRSYQHCDYVGHVADTGRMELSSRLGVARLRVNTHPKREEIEPGFYVESLPLKSEDVDFTDGMGVLGFGYKSFTDLSGDGGFGLTAPFWFLIFLAGILPFLWLRTKA